MTTTIWWAAEKAVHIPLRLLGCGVVTRRQGGFPVCSEYKSLEASPSQDSAQPANSKLNSPKTCTSLLHRVLSRTLAHSIHIDQPTLCSLSSSLDSLTTSSWERPPSSLLALAPWELRSSLMNSNGQSSPYSFSSAGPSLTRLPPFWFSSYGRLVRCDIPAAKSSTAKS
jgi:hypothetical protein